MKTNNLSALILFVLLSACGGPQKEQKESSQNKEKTEKKEETSKKADEKSSEKAEKVGMQALMDAYFKRTGEKPTFTKKDLANGYAEFTTEGTPKGIPVSQFAYYITKDGKEILAVTIPQCMQACSTSLLFFEMMNQDLVENNDKIEGMTDMNQLMEVVREHYKSKMTADEKQKESNGEMALYDEIISLPQQGTTIKFNKRSTRSQNTQTVAELQFDEQSGKFKFVKL